MTSNGGDEYIEKAFLDWLECRWTDHKVTASYL